MANTDVEIRPKKLAISVEEADKVAEELGIGRVRTYARPEGADGEEVRDIKFTDILKLGQFAEGAGVVSLDHGAILVSRQVMLRQILRLEKVADAEKGVDAQKTIAYAIGYLGTQIGKLSTIGTKMKIAAEEAAEEMKKTRQPFSAGAAAIPMQVHGDVHVHPVSPPENHNG